MQWERKPWVGIPQELCMGFKRGGQDRALKKTLKERQREERKSEDNELRQLENGLCSSSYFENHLVKFCGRPCGIFNHNFIEFMIFL